MIQIQINDPPGVVEITEHTEGASLRFVLDDEQDVTEYAPQSLLDDLCIDDDLPLEETAHDLVDYFLEKRFGFCAADTVHDWYA